MKAEKPNKNGNLRLWIITIVSIGTLLVTVISNYAVLGNELKHIQNEIQELKADVKDIWHFLRTFPNP